MCGPCSVKLNTVCSNTRVKIFYKNRDKLEKNKAEEFKNDALELRILQSLRKDEHQEFSGLGETSFLMMFRFKFGVCEKDAIKLLEKLNSDRVVHLYADHTVHVDKEFLEQIKGQFY